MNVQFSLEYFPKILLKSIISKIMQTSVARNILLGPKRVLSVGRYFSRGQTLKFRGQALFRPMINAKSLTAGFLFSTSVYWYMRNYCWTNVVLASEPVLVTKPVEKSENLMEGQMKEIIFGKFRLRLNDR